MTEKELEESKDLEDRFKEEIRRYEEQQRMNEKRPDPHNFLRSKMEGVES